TRIVECTPKASAGRGGPSDRHERRAGRRAFFRPPTPQLGGKGGAGEKKSERQETGWTTPPPPSPPRSPARSPPQSPYGRSNCLARSDPVFQGEIEGSPLHMPKIGPWWRKKPLISWEKLGVDALNNYELARSRGTTAHERAPARRPQ